MKYIVWFLGVLFSIIAIGYGVLFTKSGNDFLNPIIESKIKKFTNLDSKLESFELNLNSFFVEIALDEDNLLTFKGNYSLSTKAFNVAYRVRLDRLESLQHLMNKQVRGRFFTDGKIDGDISYFKIDGSSDLASSDTKYRIAIKDFKPLSIKSSVRGLEIQKILYMLKQPHYIDGDLDLNIDMTNLSPNNIKGDVVSKIKKATFDSIYLTKTYQFKHTMPKTSFSLYTKTQIDSNIADTKINFKSKLLIFSVKDAKFNLQDSSIYSDYRIFIPNLNNLYFLTDRELRGSFMANGELQKDKDLDINLYSNIAGGNIVAKIHNDNLKAKLKSIQTIDLLHIVVYPEVFKSTLDGKLNYNLVTQSGNFDGDLVAGRFTKNKVLSLVKEYGRVDLYKEKFSGNVDAKIKKENILTSLNLKSNKSSITTKNTKLNMKTKLINSKIDIVANKNPITFRLSGSIDSPKVKVDAKKLIEKEVKKEIKRHIDKQLNKQIDRYLKSFF